ncbi:serine/threonine-protein phosphatase 6 regulatory ankyrin repeat subunit C-like [Sycon ciliatum]|uniref:serine/threonine-protein phosphatase 6 regulatory ankyrin repeat subunit C-like n=1 Tax=Sycon ciliatum TaxID=27933 RepID=UPI0031F63F0C
MRINGRHFTMPLLRTTPTAFCIYCKLELTQIKEIRQYGKTQLHYASEQGRIDSVRHLLDNKANPNQPDEWGKAPLHYVSGQGHIDCMRHLLDSKANPNQPDKDERAPLHYAVIGNKTDCVLHLLQAGANPDLGHKAGYGTDI